MWNKIQTVLFIMILLSAAGCLGSKGQDTLKTVRMTINGIEFTVEIAKTENEKTTGLMFREHLDQTAGMIFVYEKDKKMSFYMKNTLIPLSIAFLNAEGKIMQIEDMEPLNLETVNSRGAVRYALEVNKGTFEKYGITEGDRVIFPEGFPY